ncbi:penicillin-binding protein 2 [Thermomicrobium sp. CFH 73360]|uniref:penicillin-binding protein 2 n=1 Tax=Thermomicrobium sp. CFH 73360 TaxID=2951987 RepID=UPI0020767C98|nr:penicillin-binding protein 2 [Thermomicrobium sp. CFH 73360]MCM8745232.1 penicillin-binding protein 2 [Thermomicrobium sp. CFH 73360]
MSRSPFRSPRRRRNLGPLLASFVAFLVVTGGLAAVALQYGAATRGTNSTPTGVPATVSASPPQESPQTAKEAAEAFVRAWQSGDYRSMYALITRAAQQAIDEDSFVARYEGIAREIGQVSMEITLGEPLPGTLRFPIHVVRESARVGRLEEDNAIPVIREGDGYRIDWTPSLIVADLGDGRVRWIPTVPQRGRILDHKGRPLAELGLVNRIGVIPGQIQDEKLLLERLSQLLNLAPETIRQRYAGGQPDWFMPVATLPDPIDPQLLEQLAGIPGVVVRQWPERVYALGPAAAHVTGYLSEVTAEELRTLAREGYEPGDRIGRTGIEAWAEDWLRGRRGGRLVIVAPDGRERRVLAEVPAQPAADVVTTIDLDLQRAAYEALGDRVGSVIALDPKTGAIRALVSRPSFDPNRFILGLRPDEWQALNDEQSRPLLDRATQVGYPIGSTFKVVTMAAGMEYLGVDAQRVFDCPPTFSLPGGSVVWRDWNPRGQGALTLHNALVQSCNTVFFQVGAALDERDPNLLPQMARAFGFGSETGLSELPENPGLVPDPAWKLRERGDYWARGDAVNLSIGQGFFLGTPLQVADAYAAVANGGTLWRPYLIERVTAIDGSDRARTEPKARGTLPIAAEHIAAIRSALRDVVARPNGTAYSVFQGFPLPVAGKTGTAESGQDAPHAWFVAIAPADNPQLVLVVMVEHGGEGSRVAAPIARQILEAAVEVGYFH